MPAQVLQWLTGNWRNRWGDVYVPTAWTSPNFQAGSAPVGTAAYESGGLGDLYVDSAGGSDSNGGTQALPKQTIQAAVNAASDGMTIWLRGTVGGAGKTYHEVVTIPSTKSNIIIQNYPGEAVWLDGSTIYTGWSGTGPWTHSAPNWDPLPIPAGSSSWTGAAKRLWREQVFYDGLPMTQVADGTTPAAGQFSVDRTANTVTIGSNPSGHEVRMTDLDHAFELSSGGASKIRGIGIRRYSPAVLQGAYPAAFVVAGQAHNSTIENVHFQDFSSDAISCIKTGVTFNKITVERCGHTGIGISKADNFTLTNFVIRDINRGDWDPQPTTSAFKATFTRGLYIQHGIIDGAPGAMGLWLDAYCTQQKFDNVVLNQTAGEEIYCAVNLETSDGGNWDGVQYYGYVTNIRVTGLVREGIRLNDSGYHIVSNCSVNGFSVYGIYNWQDERHNPGDTGVPFANCNGLSQHNQMLNSILYPPAAASFRIQIRSHTSPEVFPGGTNPQPYYFLGADMFDRIAGMWFGPGGGGVGTMAQLGNTTTVVSYNTPSALAAAPTSVGVIAGKLGGLFQGTTAPPDQTAEPIGTAIAAYTGAPASLRKVGPFLNAPVATF